MRGHGLLDDAHVGALDVRHVTAPDTIRGVIALIVLLYVAAAVLPLIGFGRVLVRLNGEIQERRRRIAERGHDELTYDDVDREVGKLMTATLAARRDVIADIVFVGLGLVAGAAASIWSLFI